MTDSEFQLKVVISQPFAENTYIASLAARSDCLIVDPGMDPQSIIAYLTAERLQPAAILNTHGHADHIAGNEALKRCWPDCPLVIGTGDAEKLSDPVLNLSQPFGVSLTSPAADVLVDDGERYSAAGFDLEVLLTPGHCSGHVVFLWKGSDPWILFGGDVLFQEGIGRTDFPDGDMEALVSSIRKKLFVLPEETIVFPGHGEPTTIGHEKKHNPFVGEGAGF